MSNTVTTWVLELADKITGPLKKITSGTTGASEAMEHLNERVVLGERDTREALTNSRKHYGYLEGKIKETTDQIKEMQEAASRLAPGAAKAKAVREIAKANAGLDGLRKQLGETDRDIKTLEGDLSQFKQKAANWADVSLKFNQFGELVQKVGDSFAFASEIVTVQRNISRMTETTGPELDALTARVHRMGRVFKESDQEIARAANATAKQLGISYTDALDLIQAGMEKGANINGDLINQMKEYTSQAHEIGMGGAEMMALLAKAGKDGVYSDKAIDSIKEANLSLKEMGPAQLAAMRGIGLEVEDLAGKTSMEAVRMVSQAMKGANAQARQLAMADIFKGAGEDAGMNFILGLSEMETDLNKITSVEEAGSGLRAFFADVESWAASAFGGGAAYVTEFATAMTGISSMIGIFQALKSVTTAQTVATQGATIAQRGLNLAMLNNPIGWVIGGIVLLGTAVTLAWNKFEGFRMAVFGVWEAVKTVFSGIGEFVKEVVLGVDHLLKGVFNPMNWFDDSYNFNEGLERISKAASRYGEKIGASFREGQEKGAASWAASQEQKSSGTQIDAALGAGDYNRLEFGGTEGTGGGTGAGQNRNSLDGAGAAKTMSFNIEVNNVFNQVSSELDVRKIADQVARQLTDGLRETATTL